MLYGVFRFSIYLLVISISLVGLLLPIQISSQSLDVNSEIDESITPPPADCEGSSDLSITMDDCPPPICYGETDGLEPCIDTTDPPDNGNGECEVDVFESGMRPQVDPFTCEPICYGPADQIIPCDDTTDPPDSGDCEPSIIVGGAGSFDCKPPLCFDPTDEFCPPPGSDCEVSDFVANSDLDSASSIVPDPCWPGPGDFDNNPSTWE